MKVASPKDRLGLVKEYVRAIGTQNSSYWIIPQAQALLVERCPIALGSDGKVSISRTFSGIDELTLGLMYLLKEAPGNLVSPAWRNPKYSVFVPLILAAYRTYANVPYSKWNLPDLKYVVSPVQYEYMVEDLSEFTLDQKLEWRKECKDKYRDLRTSYSPVIEGKELDDVSKYGRCILLQLWLAHPEVRHKDMWLDLSNPDELPEPLEADEVLVPHSSVTSFMNLLQEANKPKVKESGAEVKVKEPKGTDTPPPWLA